jgi:hypothetical protein
MECKSNQVKPAPTRKAVVSSLALRRIATQSAVDGVVSYSVGSWQSMVNQLAVGNQSIVGLSAVVLIVC